MPSNEVCRVVCPYWKRSSGTTVTCEGLIRKTTHTVRFRTKESREDFQAKTCERFDYSTKCKYAAELQDYYRGIKK